MTTLADIASTIPRSIWLALDGDARLALLASGQARINDDGLPEVADEALAEVIALIEASWAEGAICHEHDVDDVVPGRVCGRTLPCPEHTLGHMDCSWCDPETGRLCPECITRQAAEARDFRREWEATEKPLLDMERDLGMTRDEMMRDAGRGR